MTSLLLYNAIVLIIGFHRVHLANVTSLDIPTLCGMLGSPWLSSPGHNGCIQRTGASLDKASDLRECHRMVYPHKFDMNMATVTSEEMSLDLCGKFPGGMYFIGVTKKSGDWRYDSSNDLVTFNLTSVWAPFVNPTSGTKLCTILNNNRGVCQWETYMCGGHALGLCELADVDLCMAGKGCGLNAICEPTGPRTVNCSCGSGTTASFNKTANITNCNDIDECVKKGLCKNAACENIVGSYRCNCNKGFVKKDGKCVEPEEPSSSLLPYSIIPIVAGGSALAGYYYFFMMKRRSTKEKSPKDETEDGTESGKKEKEGEEDDVGKEATNAEIQEDLVRMMEADDHSELMSNVDTGEVTFRNPEFLEPE